MGKKLGYAAAVVMAAFVALCLIVGPTGTRDAGRPDAEIPRAVAEDVPDVPESSPMDEVSDMSPDAAVKEGGGEEAGGGAAMPEEPPQGMVLAPQEEPVQDLTLEPTQGQPHDAVQEPAQPSSESAPPIIQEPAEAPIQETYTRTYVLNTDSGKFHSPGCSRAAQISPENRREVTDTYQGMLDNGWEACKICKPS